MQTIVLVMSDQCNLNCSYCGVDKWSKRRIDPDLFLETYWDTRRRFPQEVIKVDFFGGEPLLQWDMIQYIIETIENDSLVRFTMPTNGLLLTEERIDYLSEHNVSIGLSFDGLWQNRNRLQLNGKGTLDRYLEKKELFRSIPNLTIHTMISRGCYNLLENHLFIKEHFGVRSDQTLVRDMGVWNKHNVEKLKDGITELFDYYIDNPQEGMPYYLVFHLRHFINYHLKGVVTETCGAGDDVHFFAENQKLPCTRFKSEPELIELIPEYHDMPACRSCEVRNYCKKGCLFEQIKNQGPIEELCDLYKYTYKEVKRVTRVLKNNPYFQQEYQKEVINA